MQATKERAKRNGHKGKEIAAQALSGVVPIMSDTVEVIAAGDVAPVMWPVKMAELEAEKAKLAAELAEIKTTHIRHWPEYQPYINEPPMPRDEMWASAARSDKPTVETFRDVWIANARANKARFGCFRDHGIGQLYNLFQGGNIIVAGSGPHLKKNANQLKDRAPCVKLVSVLHNFAYMEDLEANVDYYVSLDAQKVVIPEVYESGNVRTPDGKIDEEHYWQLTEKRTLLAFIGSDPELFEKWRGKVYLFSAPIPDPVVYETFNEIEPDFHHYVSAGGNVLGGATYIARSIFGATRIIWVGNSQSFDHDKNFYGWDSPHNGDVGTAMRVHDVYGYPVYTWGSYWGFKIWMDLFPYKQPAEYFNCTEGGIVGAYQEGNIRPIRQAPLKLVLMLFTANESVRDAMENRTKGDEWRLTVG